MCRLSNLFKRSGLDLPSPSDIIPEEAISYDKATGKLVVDLSKTNIPFTKLPKVWLTTVQDTNSMDPIVDYLHTCILLQGIDEQNQKVLLDFLKEGDVIVAQGATFYIIHRIVKIWYDTNGRRFKTKGDNNAKADPYEIRDKHVKWLLAGIIY